MPDNTLKIIDVSNCTYNAAVAVSKHRPHPCSRGTVDPQSIPQNLSIQKHVRRRRFPPLMPSSMRDRSISTIRMPRTRASPLQRTGRHK